MVYECMIGPGAAAWYMSKGHSKIYLPAVSQSPAGVGLSSHDLWCRWWQHAHISGSFQELKHCKLL